MPSAVYPPKYVSETRTERIDFSAFLAAGQSLSSVSVSVSVYSGSDPTPSAVVASSSVSGSTALVAYGAGVAGTIYNILVNGTTASPAGVIPVQYFLAVIPDAL